MGTNQTDSNNNSEKSCCMVREHGAFGIGSVVGVGSRRPRTEKEQFQLKKTSVCSSQRRTNFSSFEAALERIKNGKMAKVHFPRKDILHLASINVIICPWP